MAAVAGAPAGAPTRAMFPQALKRSQQRPWSWGGESEDIRVIEESEEQNTKKVPDETRRVEWTGEWRTVTMGTPKGL